MRAVWGNDWGTEPFGELISENPESGLSQRIFLRLPKTPLIKKFRFLNHLPYNPGVRISEIGHFELTCFDGLFLGVSKLKTCI